MKIRLLVTRRDKSTELLDVTFPVTFSFSENQLSTMWQMHDAAGTDYFFNKDDGTYDGWGRAVHSNEEAESLLGHIRATRKPPKIEVN